MNDIIEKIIEGSTVEIENKLYKVLGKAFYVTQNDPESIYVKVVLEDNYYLVLIPSEDIAYFGHNEGKISEFDDFKEIVQFPDKEFKLVNHDYQLVVKVEFGSLLDVEGEVEFWDYEASDTIISTAIVSKNKKRADIIAKYISASDIKVY